MKKTIRLNKSGLRNLIRESVKKALMETELTYDVDNFSGRWNKTEPNMDNFVDPEGYLDDPNHNPHHDEEWDEYVDDFGGDAKAAEEDYSWNLHDTQPVAPGVGGRYNVFSKHGIARDIDDAIAINNRRLYGDEKAKDRIAKRARTKWINGKNSPEDIEDWTNDVRYARPEAFGESKLRSIVKETVKRVINEIAMDDFDDEGESGWLDMPNQTGEEYRVAWDFTKEMKRPYGGYGWESVDSGMEEINGKEEVLSFVSDLLSKNKGCFVDHLDIEKRKDTLIGNRWDRVWQCPRERINDRIFEYLKSFSKR